MTAGVLDSSTPSESWIAHALVVRDGKALILRRNEGRYLGGYWDIPGGTVESGEDPAIAAEREVLEETSLPVVVLGRLTHFTNPDSNGQNILFHTVTYACREPSRNRLIVLAPEEHGKFAWVSRNEARDYELVWHVERTLDEASRIGLLS
jgi:8-oxo-dGTP diphosphatase